MLRKAGCAGTWYPIDISEIDKYFNHKTKRQKAIAGICPHAGWVYSGKVAGEVYSSMEPASLYILIGPNHYGLGASVSVYDDGKWETPLGSLEVDKNIAGAIIKKSDYAKSDKIAHLREHSLEVQLPFIKILNKDAKIVPIALADYRVDVCKNLGQTISQVIKEYKLTGSVSLIASTDMSHYLKASEAKGFDDMAIEKVLKLDPEGLLKVVKENDISMCGVGPTAAVIWASKDLGAKQAKLIRYSNSGEVTGDYEQVVGYAGFIIA
ncbi:MAG: AmmeMemoRadiSam system protein B [Endomicrobiales bacterium]|nr:AmmeMemoRadiSam system protein B [Endomicrobiales bacterium]